ncbi:MAG: hypothetical protein M3364_00005, partial [Actinomycetota bacterium]|nr:hypothetical protein [Actinomycetota bacterium]
MQLAGIPIRDQDVLELARLLRAAGFDDTAARLEDAYDLETKVLALTIPAREQILRVLVDTPSD